jgi:hypothetical protein
VDVGGVWEMGTMSTTSSKPSTPSEPPCKPPSGFTPAEIEAGMLAAVLPYFSEWGLEHPSLDRAFEALGVSPERAARAQAALLQVLPPELPRPEERLLSLSREVISYLKAHPDAIEVEPRRRYSRQYRRHVLLLRRRYDDLELEDFAVAVGVPPRTLARWLRGARRS